MSHAIQLMETEIWAGLTEVRESPQDNGLLEAIVIRPGSEERLSLQQCRLSPEGGTEGDAWARGCWLKLPDGLCVVLHDLVPETSHLLCRCFF